MDFSNQSSVVHMVLTSLEAHSICARDAGQWLLLFGLVSQWRNGNKKKKKKKEKVRIMQMMKNLY